MDYRKAHKYEKHFTINNRFKETEDGCIKDTLDDSYANPFTKKGRYKIIEQLNYMQDELIELQGIIKYLEDGKND